MICRKLSICFRHKIRFLSPKTPLGQVIGRPGEWRRQYKDPDVVREMKLAKSKNPTLVRPHPELPHVETAKQYKCLIHDDQVKAIEDILRQGQRLDGEVSGSSAASMMQQRMSVTATALDHAPPPVAAPMTAPRTEAELVTPSTANVDKASEPPSTDHEEAMLLLKKEKKRKQDRLDRLAEKQKERDELKGTTNFKGKKWLKILDQQISAALEVVTNIGKFMKHDLAGSELPKDMPNGIAREYGETFKNQKSTLTKTRNSLNRALQGDVDDTAAITVLASIDKPTNAFKNTHRTWKVLVNRYIKIGAD